MSDYQVIETDDLALLKEFVDSYFSKGYITCGGFFACDIYGIPRFYQAVAKPN